MTLQVFGQSARQYQISTEIYSGPLDLLLQLIERAELDITRLSLAKVTDQYLNHLRTISIRDPIEVSAFLVIAARLVLIKSLVLLPKKDFLGVTEEDDPGEVLARQLILYKKFKEITVWLHNREEVGLRTYLRMAPLPKGFEKLDLSNVKISDLTSIYVELLNQKEFVHPLSEAMTITAITLHQKIDAIIEILRKTTKSSFRSLLSADYTRLEIVVTFLALLELIKHHNVIASQETLFKDIALESIGNLSEEIETEF